MSTVVYFIPEKDLEYRIFVKIKNIADMRKKYIFLMLFAFIAITVNAQDDIYPKTTFGINYGFDRNFNAYKFDVSDKGNTFSSGSSPYSIGMDLGIQASKRIRPRLELRFVKMNYNVSWEATNLNAMFTKSSVNLFNFDINLRNDFLLLNVKKFQVFASPAIKWEFNFRNECKNIKTDGTNNYKTYSGYSVDNQFIKNTLGFGASMILKYNIIEKVGITLTPEYTYFFNKFVKDNDKAYSRLGVNLGFEYSF